MSGYYTRCHL